MYDTIVQSLLMCRLGRVRLSMNIEKILTSVEQNIQELYNRLGAQHEHLNKSALTPIPPV